MSRHRSATLAESPPVPARDAPTPDVDPAVSGPAPADPADPAAVVPAAPTRRADATTVSRPPGSRSARRKRRRLRRAGIALPAAGLALLLVVGVWGAAAVLNSKGDGASSLFESIDGLGRSGSVALLEQERQALVEMTTASKTLTVAAKPAMADPEQLLEQQNSTTASSSQTTGGTGVATTPPPANPTAAEATAESMLASFGFGTDQWSCLYDLWSRESGWNVYAENTSSGAYGIPQALPGWKMASAGADWQTDAATQIRWGLGYVKSVYGTPCSAWANEEAYGYY